MLVLSRKIGQSLIIGKDVRVKVIEIRGNQVRIGIEAPEEVAVVREELHQAVAEANRQAAQTDGANASSLASILRRPR